MRTEPVIVVLTLLGVLMVAVWLYHASIGLKHDVSWHIAFIRSSICRWRRRRKGLCPDCGHDLTGHVSGACPECGTEFKTT